MLTIQNLKHTYSSTSSIEYPDWKVADGQHAIILGNSGSGKTTLLHILGGLLSPAEGSVTINDQDLGKLGSSALDRFRGEYIGIVFQRPHLVSSLSVTENLLLAQYLAGNRQDRDSVSKILEQLDISELGPRRTHQISQGQAQRVAIARSLMNNPKVLLADEPTASLDDENCQRVVDLLMRQAQMADCTLVVATHDQRIKDKFKNVLEL